MVTFQEDPFVAADGVHYTAVGQLAGNIGVEARGTGWPTLQLGEAQDVAGNP